MIVLSYRKQLIFKRFIQETKQKDQAMNEAVAKLLDLLVHEILWPMVVEKAKKHGSAWY